MYGDRADCEELMGCSMRNAALKPYHSEILHDLDIQSLKQRLGTASNISTSMAQKLYQAHEDGATPYDATPCF